MSAEFNYNTKENINVQGKVRVTDLISRLNAEKKNRKKKKFSSWCCSSLSCNCIWDYINHLKKNIN